MDMTLDEWRATERLTFGQLAERLGVPTATQARRYALGLSEASPEVKERARQISDGRVTPEGFHRARLETLRAAQARRAQRLAATSRPEPVS